jgi:hypothetical protein
LQAIYQIGLGNRRGQGFGMVSTWDVRSETWDDGSGLVHY